VTVKGKLLSYLTDNGMWETHAEQVFQRALPDLEADSRVTWDRPAEDYPTVMYAVWIIVLKRHALEWIDEYLPKAWFRPMFTPDPKAEIARLRAETEDE